MSVGSAGFNVNMKRRSTAVMRLTLLQEAALRNTIEKMNDERHLETTNLQGKHPKTKIDCHKMARSFYNLYKRPKDYDSFSLDPSFTIFMKNYSRICDHRYRSAHSIYEKQFQKEIKNLIEFQSNACEAANLVKHLTINTYWPPLHTRKELGRTHEFFQLQTNKQKNRLRYLMSNKII